MAELSDRAFGASLLFLSIAGFVYYTTWVIITPFMPEDHFIHSYFLPHVYAVLIPVGAAVALLSFVAIFVGWMMISQSKKKR